MNSKGQRAVIEWNAKNNSFKYEMKMGDPLGYGPVIAALANKHLFDSRGFATADAWAAETFTHHYPLALERIVRGHTRVALNPASIIVSLNNGYVHSGWLLRMCLGIVKSGGTHGGLDDINSAGVLLCNFSATRDTSTSRVAGLFDGFKGRHQDRPAETGAQWVSRKTGDLQTRTQRPQPHGRSPTEETRETRFPAAHAFAVSP
jgi:hypothetical protein